MKIKLIEKYKAKSNDEKRIIQSYFSFSFGIIYSIVQFLFFIMTNSFFLVDSSLFSLSLCLSRLFCIIGYKLDKDNKRLVYVILSSILLAGGGVLYAIYSMRLLYGELPTDFGIIISITIALFSFIFIIKAIIVLIKERHNNNKYARNIRIIAFVSGLVNILLTQMSLIMANSPDTNQKYNLYFAFGIAIVTILLGAYSIIRNIVISYKKADEEI